MSLGVPSPRELYSRLTSSEITTWLAYYMLDPMGGEREDLRSGIIAATIANVNRGKGTQPFEPSDFMPKFGPEKETVQAPEDMMAQMKLITAAAKAKYNKDE